MLKRLDQRPEAILGVEVKDQLLVFLPEGLFELLRFLRLDSVLAIAGSLLAVCSVWLPGCNLAERLRDLALHRV